MMLTAPLWQSLMVLSDASVPFSTFQMFLRRWTRSRSGMEHGTCSMNLQNVLRVATDNYHCNRFHPRLYNYQYTTVDVASGLPHADFLCMAVLAVYPLKVLSMYSPKCHLTIFLSMQNI
jgi:hypothetical protein